MGKWFEPNNSNDIQVGNMHENVHMHEKHSPPSAVKKCKGKPNTKHLPWVRMTPTKRWKHVFFLFHNMVHGEEKKILNTLPQGKEAKTKTPIDDLNSSTPSRQCKLDEPPWTKAEAAAAFRFRMETEAGTAALCIRTGRQTVGLRLAAFATTKAPVWKISSKRKHQTPKPESSALESASHTVECTHKKASSLRPRVHTDCSTAHCSPCVEVRKCGLQPLQDMFNHEEWDPVLQWPALAWD